MFSRMSSLSFVAVVFFGLVAIHGPSQAKGADPEKAKEIEKELKDARFFKRLLSTKAAINSNVEGRCGRWITRARDLRKALKKLNAQYKDRYDAKYQKKFKALKKRNSLAFKDYENCFAANLRQYPAITQRYIYAYPAFRARLKRYDKQFEKVSNLDRHIAKLEEALKRAKQGDIVGTLMSASGRVRVYPLPSKLRKLMKGKKNFWSFVGAGAITDSEVNTLISNHKFRRNERLRTGANGSARIVFTSEYANGGSAAMNVGPNTQVVFSQNSAYTDDKTPKTPVVDLINGVVRVLFSPATRKKKSEFHVRAGTTVASAGRTGSRAGGSSLVLRGTEGSLSFDRKTGVAKAHLSHGDAYLRSGGRRVTLKPATTRTISAGRIGAARRLSKSQWTRIVAGTGTGRSERGAAAKFGTGPRKTRTRKRPSRRQIASQPRAEKAMLTEISRQYAKSVVDNLMFAFRGNDKKALLARTGGKFQSLLRTNLRYQSLKAFLDNSGDRPRSHKIRCIFCNPTKGSCKVLADAQREGDKAGKLSPMIFGLMTSGRNFEYKVHTLSRGKGKRLKQFMALKPVCEKR